MKPLQTPASQTFTQIQRLGYSKGVQSLPLSQVSDFVNYIIKDNVTQGVTWIPWLLCGGDEGKLQQTQKVLRQNTGVCGATWKPGEIGKMI